MALIDKKIEELLKYNGTSPRPADFDEFWERAMDEMKSVERNVELIKSNFQAPGVTCYDLYFTGVRNARIRCQFMVPENIKDKAPAVLFFHGYGGSNGDFTSALHYAACGFVTAAMDCRGQGGISEDTGGVKGTTIGGHLIRGLGGNPEDLTYRNIFLDTAELADIVMGFDFVDETRVGASGQSQGGGLALVCASLEPRIAKVYTSLPFLCDYRKAWELNHTQASYGDLFVYFRNFDPGHEHEDEVFEKLGYVDVQNFVDRIKGDVVMVTGMNDVSCPPVTQFAAYNKIKSKKTHVAYPEYGHESIPGEADKKFTYFLQLLK